MTSNETDQPNQALSHSIVDNASGQNAAELVTDSPVLLSEEQEPVVSAETITEIARSLPGEVLAARRNELRLTLEEVSQRLKLAPRQILALEANDFASLPGLASARGFVRSYAKLLELDPEPLLEMVTAETNPAADPVVLRRPLPSRGFPGRRYAAPSGHRRGSRSLSGIALLILVFVGALGYAAYRHDLLSTPGIKVPDVAGLFASLSWNVAAHKEQDNAAVQASEAPAAPAIVEQKSIDPSRLLELHLREDAWVEISTINGNKLVSRLMMAGTTEQFDMSEPVVLVVGNASGVDATLRGQPLNLRAVARDNVSKLSLK
jgi:cytoskeleton protein RodZ